MKKIEIAFLPRPGTHEASAATLLGHLLNSGRLNAFERAFADYGPDHAAGNCHDVALGLMADVMAAGCSDGWTWVTGIDHGGNDHSWIEYDGWAVDGSCGKLLVSDASWYRQTLRIRQAVERDAAATWHWTEAQTSR